MSECGSFARVAAPATARRRPAFLTALIVVGLCAGGFGAMYAVGSSLPLLGERDGYVKAARDAAERQVPKLATDAPKASMVDLVGKQAEVVYARRNAQLPLAALDLVVSLLLFAGCARALQLKAWGWSAWLLAVTASVPYQLLDLMLGLAVLRDLSSQLASVVPEASTPAGQFAQAWLSLQALGALIKAGLLLLYYVVCAMYLRRAQTRALFASDAATAE